MFNSDLKARIDKLELRAHDARDYGKQIIDLQQEVGKLRNANYILERSVPLLQKRFDALCESLSVVVDVRSMANVTKKKKES